MTFTQLRTFHALAVCGSFTKAAEYLFVTQPAITTQLQSLEKDYGVDLFERHGHELKLTDVGEQLHQISTHLFGLFDEAKEVLSDASQLRGGLLRVAADSPFFIMDLMASFKARYPAMGLKVEIGSSSQCLQWLHENVVDVGVFTAVKVPDDLYAVPFSKLDLILLVGNDHPWSKRRSIRLQDLAGVPMIMRESSSSTRLVFERCMSNLDFEVTTSLELHSQVAVREAVVSGLGIGVELDGGLIHDNRLTKLKIRDCTVFSQEYVACHSNRFSLRKVRSFIELAMEVAPTLPRAKR